MSTVLTADPIKEFLINRLYDKQWNGFYTAIEGEDNIVCDDKRLEDQIFALIALAEAGAEKDSLQEMVSILNKFYDDSTGSFHEMIDRFGIVHSVGRVRHTHIQLLASYGLLRLGEYVEDEMLIQKGLSLFQLINEKVLSKNAPSILNEQLNEPISYDKSVLSFIYGMFAAEKAFQITEDQEYKNLLNIFVKNLAYFEDQDFGGLYENLLIDQTPMKNKGKKAFSHAAAALAFIKAGRLLENEELFEKAKQYFMYITDRFKHPFLGGYWNKSDVSGKVKVDPLQSYYGNEESPFPVKLTMDQTLLLLCADQLHQLYPNESFQMLTQELASEVSRFIDESGGVFIGQGNWFSTPVDPTVPLIRHFMVPHHTAGAFYAGNTGYLPLHEKHTKTQALTLLCYSLSQSIVPGRSTTTEYKKKSPLDVKQLDFDLTKVSYGKEMNLQIDKALYLSWLSKTISGSGFGLTPYRSPLGFRSDTSPQNFSALHVVSDLTVMGEEITEQDRESILKGMFDCQNQDGGFAEQAGHLSEVFTTYCVVLTAFILGSSVPNKEKCIQFIKNCQNSDGGFGNSKGYPSDVWHTNLAVLALHALGTKPLDEAECLVFCASCQNDDGGYGVRPNAPSDTFSVFRAVDTILVLEHQPAELNKTIQWLQSCQTDTGGFMYKPGSVESFVGSYHAIAALYLLGELPRKLEECKTWLSQHQSKDGGFSRAINAPSDTTDEGFICLQASYMLERNLNPYWVAIIT
ncbi:prenyltransferase/squalene oxidase repeat-containing protein [Bacillus gobiensis]|uniref:prenyltransferase/squalene oxidase repeat-containing protein n=1 Tax=Bacillus gobiensis TaxID=1441095 RepID=UPI003D1AF664